MKYIMHMTAEELESLLENVVRKQMEPMEKLLDRFSQQQDDELLKMTDVTAKLKVTDRTIRNWVKAKKLRCYWIGGRQFFRMKDIRESMQSNV